MTKETLHTWCIETVEAQRTALLEQLKSLQSDAASDGKSTAGDKHETGRAMVHLEQEQLAKQLHECNSRLEALIQLKTSLGKLYHTTLGLIYVCVSLGKVQLHGEEVTVISGQSPVGKVLTSSKPGDQFRMGLHTGIVLAVD